MDNCTGVRGTTNIFIERIQSIFVTAMFRKILNSLLFENKF